MLVDIEAPDDNFAGAFHHEPSKDVDERRLAGPVGSEESEDLPARNLEADIVQRNLPARISLRQVLDADRRLLHAEAAHKRGSRQRQVNAPFTLSARMTLRLTLYVQRHDQWELRPSDVGGA